MGVLRLDLLGLGVLLHTLRLLRLRRTLPMHPAKLMTRLGAVATRGPLTGHALAGNFGGFRGAGAVDTLQLFDLLAELLKNGEYLGGVLLVCLVFGGGGDYVLGGGNHFFGFTFKWKHIIIHDWCGSGVSTTVARFLIDDHTIFFNYPTGCEHRSSKGKCKLAWSVEPFKCHGHEFETLRLKLGVHGHGLVSLFVIHKLFLGTPSISLLMNNNRIRYPFIVDKYITDLNTHKRRVFVINYEIIDKFPFFGWLWGGGVDGGHIHIVRLSLHLVIFGIIWTRTNLGWYRCNFGPDKPPHTIKQGYGE